MILTLFQSVKQSSLDYGPKIAIIKVNKGKYSTVAMCKLLGVSRAMLYYNHKGKSCDTELDNNVIEIFKSSRKCYGTRKIKRELVSKYSKTASRRRISSIMKKYGLVSKYTLKCYRNHKSTVNNDDIDNVLDRAFNRVETFRRSCI